MLLTPRTTTTTKQNDITDDTTCPSKKTKQPISLPPSILISFMFIRVYLIAFQHSATKVLPARSMYFVFFIIFYT